MEKLEIRTENKIMSKLEITLIVVCGIIISGIIVYRGYRICKELSEYCTPNMMRNLYNSH